MTRGPRRQRRYSQCSAYFDVYRRLTGVGMLELQPKDMRGYFMLPQAPEGAGYYVYGNVGGRLNTGHLAQYAHPNLMTLILCIEREWQAIDERKFGIGNISVAGGTEYDGHATHQKGLEMDIRPVRNDKLTGQGARLTRFDPAYDRDATTSLIRLFARHMMVRVIYFNDTEVQKVIGGGRVRSAMRHDDHFHVEIRRYA
ncbi:penicillin-insensitive murein endopeptidase [Janthinobacterium sp. 13]|nr:penicillin-insensitive murein endopeptidase [Janthinobacterium sp. 13]